ncbi:hypothetical protein [Deinococcus puniceus]|uniref:Uncharacterized protein n=1 Tax=Deinococcus puniceus TaxID=1182568 RepID=A0A172T7M3_9DEIO|nr:hypothetical protein [Deinococcus puniceus]ANE42944.1 hypothetical protein SU48_03235 [Deinococcus puniceus]
MTPAPTDRAALWPALPALPLTWEALPQNGVTLPDGTHLRPSDAPDGTLYLAVTLHESEDFQELLDGRGDYTEEELEDPDAVIDQRWQEASAVMQTLLAEAVQVLGAPDQAGADSTGQVHWLRADRTISLGLFQADKDCPIEVRLWLLPAGLTPRSLEL